MKKIITIFSQAGGVGKSTIAVNLKLTLNEAGMSPVTIVTNEQNHGLEDILNSKDYLVIPERGRELPKEVKNLQGVIIFDFAGKTDERIKEAVDMSDNVLVPTQGGSSNKIKQFIGSINDLSDFTDKLAVVVTAYDKNGKNRRLMDMANDILMRYPTFLLKKSESYNLIWDKGRSVRSMWKDGGLSARNYEKPKEDFNQLIQFIFKTKE